MVDPLIRARQRLRYGLSAARRRWPGRVDDATWLATPAWQRLLASGLFDASWYAATYPVAGSSGLHPLRHYVELGAPLGADPNPYFSTTWYRSAYPDVDASGVNPLLHYLEHGADEGRNPSPRFDTRSYLGRNPDVAAAGVNPLAHFLVAGLAEGRLPRPQLTRGTGDHLSVVLVSGEPNTPGHAYRVLRFAESVRALGGSAAVCTVPEAASTRLADLDDADVVLLWRTVWGHELERVVERARAAGATVLFDVDDLMVDPDLAVTDVIDGIRSQWLSEGDVRDWYGRMRQTASRVDGCTCSTPQLADHLGLLGHPVWVVPNGFDAPTFERSRLARRMRTTASPVVRIGYAAGSRTHQRDFAVVAEAVAKVLRERPECRLVLFRQAFDLDEFPTFDGLRDQVEWRSVVPLERLPFELARFDVNLAPLEVGNPFCEAKSPLKFFEAALVDVPTVASPTGPFAAAIDDGVTGRLAEDGDWYEAITDLVDDAAERRRMGRAARRAVLAGHGPERRHQHVASVLDQSRTLGRRAADAFELSAFRAGRAQPGPPELAEPGVVFVKDHLRTAAVTVVVPVFNYGRFLVECLDSVAAQTIETLDLVVVDDASTDDSLEVALWWAQDNAPRFNRVVVARLSENSGLARARNTGVDLVETATFLPLDADNALLPGCCEALLAALHDNDVAFAYPRILHFGTTSELFEGVTARGYLPYHPQRLVTGNYIDAMALVRTAWWAAAGGYRLGVEGWEDYDLWCRLAELGAHGLQVPEDLARYRVHGASMLHTTTHAGDRLQRVQERMSATHPWLRLLDFDRPEPVPFRPERSITRPVPAPVASTPVVRGRQDPQDSRSARLESILPLLRDPETGARLEVGQDELRAVGGGRTWPLVAGRPVLRPGAPPLVVQPVEHTGNPLPDRAQDLIASLDGWGLHLSGGGTTAAHERVVELDGALFGPTDLVGDAHALPFGESTFDLVICLNAFEHYRNPWLAAAEIRRVLRPGGVVLVHTAFLQPVHESPDHYYNCTRFGLEQWFEEFSDVDIAVSDNFHPGYALAWLAAEAEQALGEAGGGFRSASMGRFSDLWRDPGRRAHDSTWAALADLRGPDREGLAAGFELLARRPD